MKTAYETGTSRTRFSLFLAFLIILALFGAAAEEGQTLPAQVPQDPGIMEREGQEEAGSPEDLPPASEETGTESPAGDAAEGIPDGTVMPAPATDEASGTEEPSAAEPMDIPPSDSADVPVSAPAEEPEEAVKTSGTLRLGIPYQATLETAETHTLGLALSAETDVLLLTGGMPVTITLLHTNSVWQQTLQAAPGGTGMETAASMRLLPGEYLVLLEPSRTGSVSVCFVQDSEPEKDPDGKPAPGPGEAEPAGDEEAADGARVPDDTGEAETPAAQEEPGTDREEGPPAPAPAEEMPGAVSGPGPAEEAAAGTGTDMSGEEAVKAEPSSGESLEEPDVSAEGKEDDAAAAREAEGTAGEAGDAAGENTQAAEAAVATNEEVPSLSLRFTVAPVGQAATGETYDGPAGDAAKADSPAALDEEAAPQDLTVTITASCEGACVPGALMTLHAHVSDEAYQGSILWQYSADGGLTVFDAEESSGAEYSFILDETNITYWWRACLR